MELRAVVLSQRLRHQANGDVLFRRIDENGDKKQTRLLKLSSTFRRQAISICKAENAWHYYVMRRLDLSSLKSSLSLLRYSIPTVILYLRRPWDAPLELLKKRTLNANQVPLNTRRSRNAHCHIKDQNKHWYHVEGSGNE